MQVFREQIVHLEYFCLTVNVIIMFVSLLLLLLRFLPTHQPLQSPLSPHDSNTCDTQTPVDAPVRVFLNGYRKNREAFPMKAKTLLPTIYEGVLFLENAEEEDLEHEKARSILRQYFVSIYASRQKRRSF